MYSVSLEKSVPIKSINNNYASQMMNNKIKQLLSLTILM